MKKVLYTITDRGVQRLQYLVDMGYYSGPSGGENLEGDVLDLLDDRGFQDTGQIAVYIGRSILRTENLLKDLETKGYVLVIGGRRD